MSSNRLDALAKMQMSLIENANVVTDMTIEANMFADVLDIPHLDTIKVKTRELERLYNSAASYVKEAENTQRARLKAEAEQDDKFNQIGLEITAHLQEQFKQALAAGESRTIDLSFRINASDEEVNELLKVPEEPVTLH